MNSIIKIKILLAIISISILLEVNAGVISVSDYDLSESQISTLDNGRMRWMVRSFSNPNFQTPSGKIPMIAGPISPLDPLIVELRFKDSQQLQLIHNPQIFFQSLIFQPTVVNNGNVDIIDFNFSVNFIDKRGNLISPSLSSTFDVPSGYANVLGSRAFGSSIGEFISISGMQMEISGDFTTEVDLIMMSAALKF